MSIKESKLYDQEYKRSLYVMKNHISDLKIDRLTLTRQLNKLVNTEINLKLNSEIEKLQKEIDVIDTELKNIKGQLGF
jgi:hypothetical protein